MKVFCRTFFLIVFLVPLCFSQELPYSLLLEAKGGTDIAGLIPDPIVDPIIHPALLDISNPAVFNSSNINYNISRNNNS